MIYDQLRSILDENGRLSVPVADLTPETDLFSVGLSSLATVNVMLAVEDVFNVEFPDALLSRRSFQSMASLRALVERLKSEQA